MLPGDMFQKSTIVSCPRIVCTVIRVLQFTCHVMLFFAYSPTATKAILKKKVIIDLTFFLRSMFLAMKSLTYLLAKLNTELAEQAP